MVLSAYIKELRIYIASTGYWSRNLKAQIYIHTLKNSHLPSNSNHVLLNLFTVIAGTAGGGPHQTSGDVVRPASRRGAQKQYALVSPHLYFIFLGREPRGWEGLPID